MRVAYDHQIFGWQRYGGISRYFFELARHLADCDGVNLKVVSPLYVNQYLQSSFVPVAGFPVRQIRKTGRIYRELNRWLAPLVMGRFKPDVVHETYYSRSSVAPRNAKIVITIHDMIHELFPDSFTSWDSTRSEKAIAAERADHIICVSENTRKDVINLLNIDPAKTSVVHHGYELLARPSGTRRVQEPYILYVGSRGGYKNFDRLLQAYATRPALHNNFHLVAFGGGSLTNQELSRIERLSQGKWMVFQLNGDDQVLADLYNFAEVFVYPSLYEGFGIPPLEAMSCGCPVLCSNLSSLPEVVGDAAVFFEPESVESIANALERTLFESECRARLINKGLGHCSAFSWKKCSEDTLEIYREVLGQGNASYGMNC